MPDSEGFANDSSSGGVDGVPLTEDVKIAEWFGKNATKVWYEQRSDELTDADNDAIEPDVYGPNSRFSGSVILLDALAISKRYEVVQVSYPNQDGLNEREWRVVTETRLPSYFIKGFNIHDDEIRYFADLLSRQSSASYWGETSLDLMKLLRFGTQSGSDRIGACRSINTQVQQPFANRKFLTKLASLI